MKTLVRTMMAAALMAAGNLKAEDFPSCNDPAFFQKQEQWYEQRQERQQFEERLQAIEERQQRQDGERYDPGFYIPFVR